MGNTDTQLEPGHGVTLVPRGLRWRDLAVIFAVLALVSWPLQRGGGDLWIADQLFRWQGGHWALRDAWLTSALLHDVGRRLSIALWLGLVAVWALSARGAISRQWRAPLGYLLVSVLAATLLVVIFKRYSGVDCPWDLFRYGGTRLYVAPFSYFGPMRTGGGCFPAGHASAGFAWIAAPIALTKLHPAWSRRTFWLALSAGSAFGLAQQLRGAHFLSHDLWTLALCWLVATLLARLWRWDAETSNATVPSTVPHRLETGTPTP